MTRTEKQDDGTKNAELNPTPTCESGTGGSTMRRNTITCGLTADEILVVIGCSTRTITCFGYVKPVVTYTDI